MADQSTAELGDPFSVLTRQKRNHVKLNGLLQQLSAARTEDQDRVLRRIYRLVFPHAFAEEAVLWPVLRRRVADGAALTLQIEQEHQEVNELVTALEQLSVTAPERAATLQRLVKVLSEDVRDEEDQAAPEAAGGGRRSTAAPARAGLGGRPAGSADPSASGGGPPSAGQRGRCRAAVAG